MKTSTTKRNHGKITAPANAVMEERPFYANTEGVKQPQTAGAAPVAAKSSLKLNMFDFRALYQSPPEDRIALIRAGVGATDLKAFASDLGIPQDRLFRMFGIAQATVTRKASKRQAMSPDESAKIVGMAKLVGQIETMLEQSGDPQQMQGFDATKWLARWIEEPVPALGGKRPADYMDTIEGQEMVARLLAMMQTGAYA